MTTEQRKTETGLNPTDAVLDRWKYRVSEEVLPNSMTLDRYLAGIPLGPEYARRVLEVEFQQDPFENYDSFRAAVQDPNGISGFGP